MRKNIIYIALAVLGGLIAGYIIFGESSEQPLDSHDHDGEMVSNQMWTCSMHPQIMQSEPGSCPICAMDLIPVDTGEDGLDTNQFKMTENAMELANIQTSIVGNADVMESGIKLSGKIQENEDNTSTIPAHFNGRIEKLYVTTIGESISKGQAIAKVYSPELVSAQQELITAYSVKSSQPELYEAVRNKFKNWEIHDSQLSEIETSGKVITQFTIYSHVSGIVTELNVNEGSHIVDGHKIMKVTDLKTVWAVFDAYENQISSLKKGQKINISTNAYPNKKFEALISFVDPVLNSQTRTVKVRAVLNNKSDMLKPGMFVEGKTEGMGIANNQVITIPSSAVMWTGERSVVYVKTNPILSVFEMREITLGNSNGDSYVVLKGLENGEEIVTNGTFTVDAAAQLKGKKSMMNTKGEKTMTGHEGHTDMPDGASSNSSNDADHSDMNKQVKFSGKFQGQLKKIFDEYVLLKDALVNDDRKKAKARAMALVQNLDEMDMKLLLEKKEQNYWKTLEKEIKFSANHIAKSSDIITQRGHFKDLSTHLISGIKLFGINERIYIQFCPMADNNIGAYWLSLEEEILNPYYGDAMLNCGSVIDVI